MKILVADDDAVHIAFEDRKLRARVGLAPIGVPAGLENEVTEQVMNLRGPSSMA